MFIGGGFFSFNFKKNTMKNILKVVTFISIAMIVAGIQVDYSNYAIAIPSRFSTIVIGSLILYFTFKWIDREYR